MQKKVHLCASLSTLFHLVLQETEAMGRKMEPSSEQLTGCSEVPFSQQL